MASFSSFAVTLLTDYLITRVIQKKHQLKTQPSVNLNNERTQMVFQILTKYSNVWILSNTARF